MKNQTTKPLVTAISAAFIATAALSATNLSAAENPFQADLLQSGYNLAAHHNEGKCGEGKCGEAMDKAKGEGKCGEGMD
ncbi:MAG: hypothetical protein ABS23_04590, partial [SAR92 bacterium BACL16 MAG-120619-bin48]